MESNSTALHRVLGADLLLSKDSCSCWLAQVLEGFKGMPNAEHFSQQLLTASPIDVNGFVDALRCRHQSVWKVAEEQDPRAVVRKVTAYQHWLSVPFWCHSEKDKKKKKYASLPSCLYLDMPRQVVRNVSRFRLCAHRLNIETCRWGNQRHEQISSVCDKCCSGDVQDTRHTLFYCSWDRACDVHMKYEDLFADLFAPLQWFLGAQMFLPSPSYHKHKDSVCNEDVHWFLSQGKV